MSHSLFVLADSTSTSLRRSLQQDHYRDLQVRPLRLPLGSRMLLRFSTYVTSCDTRSH